ncbi:CinA family protein [Gleimia hominis]|uniref:Nicotinamide-nucleotide amidohydrolase family protein n=1 Tax=Gleimia hominis TaxID=595468 RepID=A0ABU3IBB6_9ACTO|nr:nicotinamide-nucleotide amidohydrolase family protein [Gleimia hominis]MDT3767523.1 nicotinamide-nucleotide amidohydrolase family protein [Gleimia hominis]WIK64939.1 nicotinamide-nucleotide amidohydrolase family protein [Gleimia hominis]
MASTARLIIRELIEKHETVAVAESLTGGLLSAALVDVPGASACLRGGACTYAVDTKARVLNVSGAALEETGPVDPKVAMQMARGATELFDARYGLSTTGVAGPGAADGHPAGTVYVGFHDREAGTSAATLFSLSGNRMEIRQAATQAALDYFYDQLSGVEALF